MQSRCVDLATSVSSHLSKLCFRKEALRRPAIRSAGQGFTTILFAVAFLATLASIRGFASNVQSELINFDYAFPDAGFPAYGPGPGAIGSTGDLWNSASTIDLNPVNLNWIDGTPTSAVWSWSGGGGVSTHNITGTYQGLMDVSTYVNSATISGLVPNQPYDLYLYSAYWAEVIRVNDVDFSTPGIRFGSADSLTAGVHYDVHAVTTDSAGTLTFVPVSAQYGTPYITSWQLTPLPEPISFALLGLGSLAMMAGRRQP